jgi:hypothetical protein
VIYFIKPKGMAGPIKIGCSDKPALRLYAQMVASPFPLEIMVSIPGDRNLERNLHECFADCHSHCEWFHPNKRLIDGIAALQAGATVSEAFDLNRRTGSIELRGRRRGAKVRLVEEEIERALAEAGRTAA